MRTHQLPSPTPTLTTSGATRQQDRFNHRNTPLAMASTCHPAAPARMIHRPRAMFEGPVPSQEGVPRGGASRMSRVKLTRVTPSCRFGLRRVLNLQQERGGAQPMIGSHSGISTTEGYARCVSGWEAGVRREQAPEGGWRWAALHF